MRRHLPRSCGDEPLLLHLRCGLPVAVGANRVAAALAVLQANPQSTVIISDDGLQHLALARDVQLLVFDERGAGNGWLLPAGPLREPLPAKGTQPNGVATLVVYNAARQTTPLAGSLARSRLSGAVELSAWWRGEPASVAQLSALRGRPVIAMAGVARPQRFFSMLRAAGIEVGRAAAARPFRLRHAAMAECDDRAAADRKGCDQARPSPIARLHGLGGAARLATRPASGRRHAAPAAPPGFACVKILRAPWTSDCLN